MTALLWLIVCVALVLGLAYWYTRLMAGQGRFGPGAGGLEVRGQLPLGRDQRVVLVQAGERWLLLGATASQITLLAVLTPVEAAQWQKGPPAQKDAPSFGEAFLNLMKQKKERR